MRAFVCIAAILFCAGCQSVSCGVVEQIGISFEKVAPEYEEYVRNDATLREDQRRNRLENLDAHRALLEEIEELCKP